MSRHFLKLLSVMILSLLLLSAPAPQAEAAGPSADPGVFPGHTTSASPSANGWHACALRSDGSLAYWGKNDYGQRNPPAGAFTQVSMNGLHGRHL
jgi:hypothetical protein